MALRKCAYELFVKTELYARFESEASSVKIIDTPFANCRTYGILSVNGSSIEICDAKFILPKLEHIIAMKLHAVKYGREYRGSKDFHDIVDLVKDNDIDVQTSYFRELCLKYETRLFTGEFKMNCQTCDDFNMTFKIPTEEDFKHNKRKYAPLTPEQYLEFIKLGMRVSPKGVRKLVQPYLSLSRWSRKPSAFAAFGL